MNARMGVYPAENGNPVIGRMLSPDIFVQAPGYTQSYNRYSYCMNNPLRYTDPSGWYVAYGSNSFGRFVYGPNINLCSTGNYENVVGGGGGGGAGGFGYGTAAYSGGGSSGSFIQQLASSTQYLPSGYYNLTGLDYNNGSFEFTYDYNSAGTEEANRQKAYNERTALGAASNSGYGKRNPGDPPVTNIWFNSLFLTNSNFIPISTSGRDLINYSFSGTPISISFSNDAKISLSLSKHAGPRYRANPFAWGHSHHHFKCQNISIFQLFYDK